MQGHGYTQPVKQHPPTGLLVFLRVLFVVLSVLSFGLLAWAMMLRLAIVTRRALDWWLFGAVIVLEVLGFYLLGSEGGDEIHTTGGWTGLALILGTLVAAISYYLSADVRHFHQLRFPAYAPQQPPAPAYGYPQPQSQTPYPAGSAPQTPPPMPRTPAPIPQPPLPTTPPRRPAPARIDQVRAELDELSDYLRKHDSHHDSHHDGNEGGR